MTVPLSDDDLEKLVECIEYEQDYILPPHLEHLQAPEVVIPIVTTELIRRSPPLIYETGPFVLERGVEESLYHQRPMTLVQTIKFQDPSYIRFVQRHYGFRMTGNVEDLYAKYAKYFHTVGPDPIFEYLDLFTRFMIFNPDKTIDEHTKFSPETHKLLEQHTDLSIDEIKEYVRKSPAILDEVRRSYVEGLLNFTLEPFYFGALEWIARFGDIDLLAFALALRFNNGDDNMDRLKVMISVLCESFRYANMTYVKRCYVLLTKHGFSIATLNRDQLTEIVSAAVARGNVPLIEYVMTWIRRESKEPDMREVLWLGWFFGSVKRNDYVNMDKYAKLLNRHYPKFKSYIATHALWTDRLLYKPLASYFLDVTIKHLEGSGDVNA